MSLVIKLPKGYNDMAEPYKAFRFLVTLEGQYEGAFTRFSGIKMEVQTIHARSGNDGRGVVSYVPATTSYSPVTLSKGVLGPNLFHHWLASVSPIGVGNPTGVYRKLDLGIIALNEDNTMGVVWTLYNAMPVAYELSPMDSFRSEVLTDSVTFSIEGLDVDVEYITLQHET